MFQISRVHLSYITFKEVGQCLVPNSMVVFRNSCWFFTVNLWQVESPLGDDILPPKNLTEAFEEEAKPEQEEPAHEEPKDSVVPTESTLPEKAKQARTPPPAQHTATPQTELEIGSEHPGSEADEDSESKVPL